MARVVVATVGRWNVEAYRRWATKGRHPSQLIERREDLTAAALAAFRPDYVCFLQWHWRIPADVHGRFECIGFHMSDLPFGRGGSPLQNLIQRRIYATQLSAFRVGEELDAGPVYLKRPLSLHGSADEIYTRGAGLAFEMLEELFDDPRPPAPQTGEVVTFRRRTPAESEIPKAGEIAELHDFIRMLDADGYPAAFLVHQGFRYEFSRATLRPDGIVADVKITPLLREGA